MKGTVKWISDFFDDDVNFYGTAIGAIAVAMLLDRITEPKKTFLRKENGNNE